MKSLAPRPLLLFVTVWLLVSLAVPALAQRRGPRSFPAGLAEARLVIEKAEQLAVSKEVLEKLDALVTETRAKEEALREQTTEATAALRALLDEGRPSEKAVMEAGKRAADVGRQTRELRLHTSLAVRALLTDQQLEKFMTIRKKATPGKRGKKQGS